MSSSGIDKARLSAGIRKIIDKKVNGKLPNLCEVTAWHADGDKKTAEPAINEAIREPGDSKLLMTVERLVDLIEDRCNEWSEAVGGQNRFTCRIYCEGNPRPVFSQPLTVYSDDIASIDNATGLPIGDVQPSRRGELAMELRHRENFAQLYMNGIQENQRSDREELSRLRKALEIKDAAYARLIGIVEEAQSQAFQRSLMQKEAHEKSEMLRMIFGKVASYLPMIVQAVVGGRGAVVNVGENLDLAAIRGMYTGLPEDARQELNMFLLKFFNGCDDATKNIGMRIYKAMLEDQKTDQIKAVEHLATSMPSLLGAGR